MIGGKRSRRRGDEQRMKSRTRRYYWLPADATPRDIGFAASVHGVPCSCPGHDNVSKPEVPWERDMALGDGL